MEGMKTILNEFGNIPTEDVLGTLLPRYTITHTSARTWSSGGGGGGCPKKITQGRVSGGVLEIFLLQFY